MLLSHSFSLCWQSKLPHPAWETSIYFHSVLAALLSEPHSFCIKEQPLTPPITAVIQELLRAERQTKRERSGKSRRNAERRTAKYTVYSLYFSSVNCVLNNEWNVHVLSRSLRLSPFWTLSCSAEESTSSPDPPGSAVIKCRQQREHWEERWGNNSISRYSPHCEWFGAAPCN